MASVRRCRPFSNSSPSQAMSSFFEGAEVTSSSSCVGRRWFVPLCQAAGERTFHLATGYGRNRLFDPCAAFDATGRHRLASAAENLDSRGRRVSDKRDSPLFMSLLRMYSDLIDGILCPWILLSCRILTRSIARP